MTKRNSNNKQKSSPSGGGKNKKSQSPKDWDNRTRFAPGANAIVRRSPVPAMMSVANGLRIKHTEYWGTVSNAPTQVWSASAIGINPSSGFWLASMNLAFARYRWKRIRLHYIGMCGTTTSGNVTGAVYYDKTEANTVAGQSAVGYAKAYNMQNASNFSCVSWAGAKLGDVCVEVDLTHATQPYYQTVNGSVPTAAVVNNGNTPAYFVVTTDGISVNSATYGQLYIEYEVEFFDPVSPAVGGVVASLGEPAPPIPDVDKWDRYPRDVPMVDAAAVVGVPVSVQVPKTGLFGLAGV